MYSAISYFLLLLFYKGFVKSGMLVVECLVFKGFVWFILSVLIVFCLLF